MLKKFQSSIFLHFPRHSHPVCLVLCYLFICKYWPLTSPLETDRETFRHWLKSEHGVSCAWGYIIFACSLCFVWLGINLEVWFTFLVPMHHSIDMKYMIIIFYEIDAFLFWRSYFYDNQTEFYMNNFFIKYHKSETNDLSSVHFPYFMLTTS